jgi:D-3-phosphoglycerate dehydrogenase
VFETEPTTASPLFELPNVVVTPHLGASTAEAQDRAGTDVARSVLLALRGDFVPDAVNVASGGVVGEEVRPFLPLTQKLGKVLAALGNKPPTSITVEVRGELSTEDVTVLPLAAMRGVFSGLVEDQVTFVNAPRLAATLGVTVDIVKEPESAAYRSLVTLRAVYSDGATLIVAGTLSGLQQVEKVVEINGRGFDLRADGYIILLEYQDRPGVMGRVGTLLGEVGINIEAAQLSQTTDLTEAVMLLRVDRPVDPAVLASIGAAVGARLVRPIDFG